MGVKIITHYFESIDQEATLKTNIVELCIKDVIVATKKSNSYLCDLETRVQIAAGPACSVYYENTK